jgi:hypothetical protein
VTPRDELFRAAVIDGGALGAAAIDVATRATIAGFAHTGLASPALLDLLLGAVPPSGPLTRLSGGAPPTAARELFVAGAERAVYCAVLERGELIVVATPTTMSVALGWTLVRGLTAAGNAT